MSPVFRIIPTVQGYDWGKRGTKSKVAQLAMASKLPDFQLHENAPYAEVISAFFVCQPGLKEGLAMDGDPHFLSF